MNCSIIDKYDIFLSAGGDNFAQAPDGSLYHLLLDLMKIGDKANKLKKFYVLWGASIGPFSEENLRKIRENLMKANALFPREKISFNYLKLIGIADEKNHLVADPAFWMKPDYAQMPIEKKSNELIIGLNISSLSIKVSFENYQLGTKIVFSALDSLLKKNPRCRFLCIPHVMTIIGGSQDDFSFMRLYKQFTKFKNRVDILDFGLGARKTKAIISQCDLLIASRMHCCVAGISSGTPTLFLTYSQKGIGMAKYAYDDLEMLLQIQQVSKESLYQKFKYIEKKLHHYKEHLNFQHDRFKSDAAAAMIILKNLYTKN
jgi:polysaccharide pyruvyl transferase WcaK-like protein